MIIHDIRLLLLFLLFSISLNYVWDYLSTDNPLECTTKSPLDGDVSLYFNTDQAELIDFLFSQSQTELYYTLQILDFQNRNLH